MLSESDALARLKDMVAWTAEPALTEPTLLDCLTETQRYGDYPGDGATVEIDSKVRPTGSRRVYRCLTAGVTAGVLSTLRDTSLSDVIGDGSVVWGDIGPAFKEKYNLDAAARKAWERKAAIATEQLEFSAPGQTIHQEQLIANCLRMASRYVRAFAV